MQLAALVMLGLSPEINDSLPWAAKMGAAAMGLPSITLLLSFDGCPRPRGDTVNAETRSSLAQVPDRSPVMRQFKWQGPIIARKVTARILTQLTLRHKRSETGERIRMFPTASALKEPPQR